MDYSYGSDLRIPPACKFQKSCFYEKILKGRNHFTNAANYIAPIRKAKWVV